jgi:hypothetical protein
VTVKIIVFWSVTPCSLADGFQRKQFPYIFRVEEDGGSRPLQNVGVHESNYTALYRLSSIMVARTVKIKELTVSSI